MKYNKEKQIKNKIFLDENTSLIININEKEEKEKENFLYQNKIKPINLLYISHTLSSWVSFFI